MKVILPELALVLFIFTCVVVVASIVANAIAFIFMCSVIILSSSALVGLNEWAQQSVPALFSCGLQAGLG